jgi:hypothetical protein
MLSVPLVNNDTLHNLKPGTKKMVNFFLFLALTNYEFRGNRATEKMGA